RRRPRGRRLVGRARRVHRRQRGPTGRLHRRTPAPDCRGHHAASPRPGRSTFLMTDTSPDVTDELTAEGQPPVVHALGGAYEGASRIARETARWSAPIFSPDREINLDKQTIDARARDLIRNDGYMMGAVATHKDSIVGSHFILNSRPDYRALGLDETWSEEFQEEVESKFALWGRSEEHTSELQSRENLVCRRLLEK